MSGAQMSAAYTISDDLASPVTVSADSASGFNIRQDGDRIYLTPETAVLVIKALTELGAHTPTDGEAS